MDVSTTAFTVPPLCGICADAKAPLTCPECKVASCVTCHRTWMRSHPDVQVRCLNKCPHVFSRSELLAAFGPKFFNKAYRDVVSDALLAATRLKLPAVQTLARVSTALLDEKTQLRAASADVKKAREALREAEARALAVRQRVAELEGQAKNERLKLSSDAPVAVNAIQCCPRPQCRGFIAPETHACGVCNATICRDCRVLLSDNTAAPHVCNPDVLASATTVRNESKPCPKCAAPIARTSGCDQMFCTACKTVFSWATLTIEVNKPVHNPLAVEDRAAANAHTRRMHLRHQLCIQDPNFIQTVVRNKETLMKLPLRIIEDFLLYGFHMLRVTWDLNDSEYFPMEQLVYEWVRHYRTHCSQVMQDHRWHGFGTPQRLADPQHQSNDDLLVAYVHQKMTDAQLSSALYKRHVAIERAKAIRAVYTRFFQSWRVSFHLFANILHCDINTFSYPKLKTMYDGYFQNGTAAVARANAEFAAVQEQFKPCKVPVLRDDVLFPKSCNADILLAPVRFCPRPAPALSPPPAKRQACVRL